MNKYIGHDDLKNWKENMKIIMKHGYVNVMEGFIEKLLNQQLEEILGLEEFKKQKHHNFCLHEDVDALDCDCGADLVNKKLKNLKQQIIDYKNK